MFVVILIGCAVASVMRPSFRVYVENRTFEDVKIRTSTGFLLGRVRAGEHTSLLATCADYLSRRSGFTIERERGRAVPYPLFGEYIGSCADSLVIYIPASGISRSTVAVW